MPTILSLNLFSNISFNSFKAVICSLVMSSFYMIGEQYCSITLIPQSLHMSISTYLSCSWVSEITAYKKAYKGKVHGMCLSKLLHVTSYKQSREFKITHFFILTFLFFGHFTNCLFYQTAYNLSEDFAHILHSRALRFWDKYNGDLQPRKYS